jgi:protein-S-isoprenylcysteine O-methyltransferase Ste14
LTDALRRTLGEIAEKSAGRWLPVLSGLLWVAAILVSVIDLVILQHGGYNLTAVGIAGAAFLVGGLGLYVIARRALGEFFSEDVRIIPEHKLVTGGPYRLIRHPIYLGEIFFGLSIPMILGSLYGFIIMLVPILLVIYRIGIEEKMLVSRFGQEYLDYASKTKKLIPYIY